MERIIKKLLDLAQDEIDKAYKEDGLTDEILDLQIKANELRAKYNITGDEFLQ